LHTFHLDSEDLEEEEAEDELRAGTFPIFLSRSRIIYRFDHQKQAYFTLSL